MQPGAMFRLTVPAALGHGSAGVPGVIPPHATLVFTVTLLSIGT
jgi:FKBP-type peptidyl-prolyl cis-trans isomerase